MSSENVSTPTRKDQEEEPKNDDLPSNSDTLPADENDGITMSSVSSWLSGWYDTAKQKVVETNEFMKRDLQEFSQAVQTDASKLVAATATTMKEKLHINVDLEEASSTTRSVKNSLSNFLGNIAHKVGPILPDDDENDDESAIIGTSTGTAVLSPSEARIHAIRTDPATFCNEPDNEEGYFMWLPSFNVEEKKSEISTLMLDCSQIRSLYTKLVPSAVSHSDFWARYFYKLHQLAEAEERRAMLMERARKAHDDIEWDDEDDEPVQKINTEEQASTKDDRKEAVSIQCNPGPIDRNSPDFKTDVGITETEASQLEIPDSRIESDHNISPINTGTSIEDNKLQTTQHTGQVTPETETQTTTSEVQVSNDKNDQLQTIVKTPSTESSSDDWEKDFDLDMTEDEIQQALKESEAIDVDPDDIGDDWDEWE